MTKDEIEKYLIKNYSTTDNKEIKTVTGLTTDKLRHICKRLNLFKYDRTPVSLTGQNFKKVLIGSKHGKSKLNESQVNSICRLIKSGVVDSEIVKRLNLQVSPQCIMQIRKGKNWKHISSKYF